MRPAPNSGERRETVGQALRRGQETRAGQRVSELRSAARDKKSKYVCQPVKKDLSLEQTMQSFPMPE
jgi:hypothetical protein